MIAALFLVNILWLGLILDDEFNLSQGDLLVRIAAAISLGCFSGAWCVFLLAGMFGFTDTLISCTTLILSGFNLYSWKYRRRDLAWLTSLRGFNSRFWQAGFLPVVLITALFAFEIRFNDHGDLVFRGNSQDLAFHMATVSAFVNQTDFPPLNPQSGAAKLSYHFMANFLSAVLCKGGFSLFYSLKIPMVLSAFALCTLTAHFFYSVLMNRAATLFAGLLFFFGHVGVINLVFGLLGYPSGNGPVQLGSWQNIEDHLGYPYFNFLNIIVDYFQPQLPFLVCFPVAMLVLLTFYRHYAGCTPANKTTWLLLGIVAFFPLFHIHTFLVLCPLVVLLVLAAPPIVQASHSDQNWLLQLIHRTLPADAKPAPASLPLRLGIPRKHQIIKILSLCAAAIPISWQLSFIFSQKKTPGFSGFDVADKLGSLSEIPDFFYLQRVFFWIRAGGIPLVLGLVCFIIATLLIRRQSPEARRNGIALSVIFMIGAAYFIVINFFRFTPNWGDSNKLFLYWDLTLCAYSGWGLSMLWRRSRLLNCAVLTLIALGAIIPSAIEWQIRFRRPPEQLFSASDQLVADWIRINTPADAVFLTANSIVHFLPALSGRRVVNGAYTRETGFADFAMEELVSRVYREASPSLITRPKVTHVLVGPAERGLYRIDRSKWERRHWLLFDQTSLGTRYSIYKVREITPADARKEHEYEKAKGFVWLSELNPVLVAQQYGQLSYDTAFNLAPLTLAKHEYTNGLGTHAASEIHFSLDGNYTLFETDIGLDDSQTGGSGSIVFQVWLDDRNVYTSKIMRAGDPPESLKIDVQNASLLKLVVTDAGDDNHCDHADWAGAKLIKKQSEPSHPQSFPAPNEDNSPQTESASLPSEPGK